MTQTAKEISTTSEKGTGVPKGAEILKTETRVTVEEIENGFIITKSVETKYRIKESEHSDWDYNTKKYYSKTDPLEIKLNDKSLAESFDADSD